VCALVDQYTQLALDEPLEVCKEWSEWLCRCALTEMCGSIDGRLQTAQVVARQDGKSNIAVVQF